MKAIEKAIKTPQKTQFNIITKTKIIIRKSKVQIKTIIKNYNVKYFIFKCTPTPNIKNVQKKHIFNKHLVFKLIKPKKILQEKIFSNPKKMVNKKYKHSSKYAKLEFIKKYTILRPN